MPEYSGTCRNVPRASQMAKRTQCIHSRRDAGCEVRRTAGWNSDGRCAGSSNRKIEANLQREVVVDGMPECSASCRNVPANIVDAKTKPPRSDRTRVQSGSG